MEIIHANDVTDFNGVNIFTIIVTDIMNIAEVTVLVLICSCVYPSSNYMCLFHLISHQNRKLFDFYALLASVTDYFLSRKSFRNFDGRSRGGKLVSN